MLACPSCDVQLPLAAKFCPECGTKLHAVGVTQAREVRKTVTVLFSDLAGSTALGERLDPEPLRALMARYFDVMRAIIEGHGGMVEKFIGDAIMAVFGIPVLHEDDALRAVRAADEMREGLRAFNAGLADAGGIDIRTRTGVNTGEVVASADASGANDGHRRCGEHRRPPRATGRTGRNPPRRHYLAAGARRRLRRGHRATAGERQGCAG